MSDLPGGVQLLLLMGVMGLVGLAIGNARGQAPTKSLLVSALLGPLGWLLILVSKPDREVARQCPACLGTVPVAAVACRHCGRDLPPAEAESPRRRRPWEPLP